MTDPVLALVLIAAFFVVVSAASYFKTLEAGFWIEARLPLIAGVICGALIYYAFVPGFLATGVILTIAALYVRLMGSESEPADGMILGSITGAAAAIPPLLLGNEHELVWFAECVLAGAASGYGITFGLTHVRDKLKQAGVDGATAVVAVAAAWLPWLVLRSGRVTELQIGIAAAVLVPLLVVTTVFKQWPSVRAELRHEAALGFIDEEDVRATAHPLLRLGRAGWHDAEAHRAFVRMANKIALRKRQQRTRAEEIARLYQLEVIKLRMQMQEMSAIDRRMRADERGAATMRTE